MSQYDEGSKCKFTDCNGTIELEKVENCSCHIDPPCQACIDTRLVCSECGWNPDEED